MTKLGTENLPTDVVKTPFTLAIWSATDKKHPRKGVVAVGLLFGSRDNPADLTVDEREYILACLRYAIDGISAGDIPQGGEGESEDWESKYFFAGYPPYTRSEEAGK